MRDKKGFTLVEMLVVIAIIAVLVAIIVPTVTSATDKAKASTDAANLRTVQGEGNVVLAGSDLDAAISDLEGMVVSSKTFPNAHMYVAYGEPGFVKIYYVDSGKYYGLEYFSDVAHSGKSTQSTAKPTISGIEVTWYDLTAKTKLS